MGNSEEYPLAELPEINLIKGLKSKSSYVPENPSPLQQSLQIAAAFLLFLLTMFSGRPAK